VAVVSTTGPQLSELPAAHPGLTASIPHPNPDTPGGSALAVPKQQIVGTSAACDPFMGGPEKNLTEVAGRCRNRRAGETLGRPSWTGSSVPLTAPTSEHIGIGRAGMPSPGERDLFSAGAAPPKPRTRWVVVATFRDLI
jgi:hypothetical protein